MTARRVHRARGVTLLELLVAMAVFAVIGVGAYTALFSVLDAREATQRQAERLAAVQRSVDALVRDLRQAVERPVRSVKPAQRAPLLAQRGQQALLTLTRGGWLNPADLPRSTLARVSWSLRDGRLRRRIKEQPDARARPNQRPDRVYLREVESVELRFRDGEGNWQDQWPPLNTRSDAAGLPLAVEFTITLTDWGEIRRLVAMPDGGPSTGPGGDDGQDQAAGDNG